MVARGLQQGNPLSPYLFLNCVEGLSAVCAWGLAISHLFFVDDSLIFCRATKEDCSTLLIILDKYEIASSQQLNREKTSLYFRRNTSQVI